ncbi:hypothetical protein D3C81_523590 [compost metagenome]
MSQRIEQLLSQIPDREEIIKKGTAKEVEDILALVVMEFRDGDGNSNAFAKCQDEAVAWKWYVELPFCVSEYVQHAVRDALAEKDFSIVHFNDYGSFEPGVTRMSITVMKSAA